MTPRLRKIRNIICVAAVVLLCLACIFLGDFSDAERAYDLTGKTTVTGKITEIGRDWIHVLRESGKECSIPIRDDTKLLNADGKKIKSKGLSIGQRVEALVPNSVTYEPMESFDWCYELRVIE